MAGLVGGSGVVVCCGPGGVGKTSVAASVALESARRGRRAAVVTVDPARRLADALGIAELGNTPQRIEGSWSGELWALMLDARSTFDALVQAQAVRPGQAEAILANRFYRNIAGALSGTQEYMAMEKLHELHASGHYDVIVVDTPPTRNALDFIDAPRRLVRFLDNRLTRLVLFPTRASLRAVNVAAQAFLRTVSKVVGGEVVGEAVAFFQTFEGMEAGFRTRARQVQDLLAAEGTAFLLVTSPRADAVDESRYLAERLVEGGIAVSGLVVNRGHPPFDEVVLDLPTGSAAAGPLARLEANLRDLRARAAVEEAEVARLAAEIGSAPVSRVPLLAGDVCDLEGLGRLGRYVFAA